MYNFSDKVVVITGAAKGLGAAIADRFINEGVEGIALLDMNQEILDKTVEKYNSSDCNVIGVACNVTEYESVKNAFDVIEKKFGRVDILINNAGITRDSMFHKMTEEQFDAVVKVSLYGTFNCSKQVIDGMRERGYGRIVSLSSLSNKGNIGQTNYSAAKAGIIGFTKALALESASKGITVNCIAPGMFNTDIIKTVPEKIQDKMKNDVPMKRFGEPEEVANLIMFLSSDESAYISGQCIEIAGGRYCLS